MQWITALDFQILHEIQNRFSCSFLDFWMPKITALGNGGILWILLAVLLLCISKTRKNGIQLGVGNMGCGLIGNLLLKNLVARDRPCWLEEHAMLIAVPQDYSFPSGHTSNAFLGAHMAYKEFKDSSPILAYSGYAIAAFVAGSRLYNNRHWVADVVAGAGFGILSVELSYLIYFPIRNAIARRINRNVKNCPIVAAPVFSSNMAGFYLTYQF